MQARLMETAPRPLARGVTVVCTTHTLDTLNFFDRLLVLGLKDRIASVAYFGSPARSCCRRLACTADGLVRQAAVAVGCRAGRAAGRGGGGRRTIGGPQAPQSRKIRAAAPPPGKERIVQQAKWCSTARCWG